MAHTKNHVEDKEHAAMVCRRAVHLPGEYSSLFTHAHTHSMHTFLSLPKPQMLASFCRSLYGVHTTLT